MGSGGHVPRLMSGADQQLPVSRDLHGSTGPTKRRAQCPRAEHGVDMTQMKVAHGETHPW